MIVGCIIGSGIFVSPTGVQEVILTGVNCWSVKYTAMVQDWFTYGKVLALLTVILTGGYRLIFGGPQYRDSFDNLFEGNFRHISEPAAATLLLWCSSSVGARALKSVFRCEQKRRQFDKGASFLAIVYLLIAGHIYTLINASQCTVWLAIAVVALALLRFRWSMPDAPRPVKEWNIASFVRRNNNDKCCKKCNKKENWPGTYNEIPRDAMS
ncbi:hypothetical protein TELCIR_08560 [Teladorsagia circumcincta]|uniref:Uncharacterized protein n=1 Tax=Teladorsagia circumcincta TaxID=45464 RepID=A0A2G9UH74_TELCI|nr:hypothetical protein TELCIR_08560 [Teladorsagia circumcincta]